MNIAAIALLKERTKLIHEKEISHALSEKIYFILFNFIKIYSQRLNPDSFRELKVEIRIMNAEGSKKEFEVKSDFFCDNGIFSSKKVGWNLYEITKNSIASIKSKLFSKFTWIKKI
ncbi:MAG: hypothetical protein WC548_02375 [Candidatus Pacearchaeota archaeon]